MADRPDADPLGRAAAPPGHRPARVPRIGPNGLVMLDPWWGTIQPLQLHPELPTYGELELLTHLRGGGALVDTRRREYVAASGTIPGARVIPWEDVEARAGEIDPAARTVLFCNGPQCAATPRAVATLLRIAREPQALGYYRGGLQDWIGLGLPMSDAPS
jgi:rhodanese-related sulfurtransferase